MVAAVCVGLVEAFEIPHGLAFFSAITDRIVAEIRPKRFHQWRIDSTAHSGVS